MTAQGLSSTRQGGEGRRTWAVAEAASGFAARSACTTATDELLPAAQ
jgi:hypothetical protein